MQDLTPARRELLARRVGALPGVVDVTLTSQPPFVQGRTTGTFQRGDGTAPVTLLEFGGDARQLDVFGIDLVAGRGFDVGRDGASRRGGTRRVVLNERAARALGFTDPAEAVGAVLNPGDASEEARVVGVARDVNYLGLHNRVFGSAFVLDPGRARYLAIRTEGPAIAAQVSAIRDVWQEVAPDRPYVARRLDGYFGDLYGLFGGVGAAIAPLAIIALALALAGLASLCALSARRRRREVAIRKVNGATTPGIAGLFLRQHMVPVGVAVFLGVPLAAVAGSTYLSFFADKTPVLPLLTFGVATAVTVLSVVIILWQVSAAASARPALVLRED